MDSLSATLDCHGGQNIGIYVTEYGSSTDPSTSWGVSEVQQAQYNDRFMEAVAQNTYGWNIDMFLIYTFLDKNDPRDFGIVREDGSHKPSYAIAQKYWSVTDAPSRPLSSSLARRSMIKHSCPGQPGYEEPRNPVPPNAPPGTSNENGDVPKFEPGKKEDERPLWISPVQVGLDRPAGGVKATMVALSRKKMVAFFSSLRKSVKSPKLVFNMNLGQVAGAIASTCSTKMYPSARLIGAVAKTTTGFAAPNGVGLLISRRKWGRGVYFKALKDLSAQKAKWNCAKDKCLRGKCNLYRQIVHSKATRVGCARSRCGNSKWQYIVCLFDAVLKKGVRSVPKNKCPRGRKH